MASQSAIAGKLEVDTVTPDARRFAEMASRNGHHPLFFGYSPAEIGKLYNLIGAKAAKLHVQNGEVQVLWTNESDISVLSGIGARLIPPHAKTYSVKPYPGTPKGYVAFFY